MIPYPFYGFQSARPPAVQNKRLLKDQYEVFSTDLGSGTYGKVKLAVDRNINKKLAIKIVLIFLYLDLQKLHQLISCSKTY